MESMTATMPIESTAQGSRERTATIALLVATLFWGSGFTWAKSGGEAVNRLLELPNGSAAGPVWLLAFRFVLAGALWMVIFPASRRGWTWRGAGRTAVAGLLLASGLVTQHLGLDRASEAVTAFLTSLTILFVPLLMTLFLRRPPPGILWAGVGLATVGVWMMTGASPGGFGVGEALGLACAVLFSLHIIAINIVVTRDDPARVAPGQFFTVGVVCAVTCLFVERGPEALLPGRSIELALHADARWNLLLMIVLVTICAFGLQTHFQPRIDPTRAALLYLVEPIFAAAYAWIFAGRGLAAIAAAGAGLILAANVMVEMIQSRRRSRPLMDAGQGPAIVD